MSDNTDNITTIVWGDPPKPQRGRKSKWVEVLTPFIERPGTWGKFHVAGSAASANSLASQLRNGNARKPEGAWEFAARGNEVFARYLGDDPALAPAKRSRRTNGTNPADNGKTGKGKGKATASASA